MVEDSVNQVGLLAVFPQLNRLECCLVAFGVGECRAARSADITKTSSRSISPLKEFQVSCADLRKDFSRRGVFRTTVNAVSRSRRCVRSNCKYCRTAKLVSDKISSRARWSTGSRIDC